MNTEELPPTTELHSGYDYEFVTPLDPKYECAICLSGLRKPIQTPCGHRFCYDCIYGCLRCNELCPVDNKELKESDLFKDSCIEREILQLKVRCPNHTLGCKNQIDLKYIDDHKEACSFKPIICPSECAATMLQRDLQDHLADHCLHRLIKCKHCLNAYPFLQKQLHIATCSRIGVSCDLCEAILPRSEVALHKIETCPHAEISCSFVEHGCQFKGPRDGMKNHMDDNVDAHLLLFSSALKRLSTLVIDLQRSIPFSRHPSFRSQISTTSIPERSPTSYERTLDLLGAVGCHQDDDYTFSKLNYSIDEEVRDAQVSVLMKDTLYAKDTEDDPKKQDIRRHPEYILKDLGDKIVDMNQRIVEEMIKSQNMSNKMVRIDSDLKAIVEGNFGRFCNGRFLWKISNLTEIIESLLKGRVLHSPSFYSSPYGYKFCLRTNILLVNNAQHLTLYIHVMKGDYDDVLSWPFNGKLTFSLFDLRKDGPKLNLTETMEIKDRLLAFEEPDSFRSGKGYGFKDFVLLDDVLKPSSYYRKNDSIYFEVSVISDI